jgi:hypothetical protein
MSSLNLSRPTAMLRGNTPGRFRFEAVSNPAETLITIVANGNRGLPGASPSGRRRGTCRPGWLGRTIGFAGGDRDRAGHAGHEVEDLVRRHAWIFPAAALQLAVTATVGARRSGSPGMRRPRTRPASARRLRKAARCGRQAAHAPVRAPFSGHRFRSPTDARVPGGPLPLPPRTSLRSEWRPDPRCRFARESSRRGRSAIGEDAAPSRWFQPASAGNYLDRPTKAEERWPTTSG